MTADDLNAVLAASREAAAALEARIADEVEPILRQAGATAARRFAAAVETAPLTAAAPTRRSAMVAVYPKPAQAVTLAGAGTEPADVIHCTLAFLGEPDDATIALARQVVAAVAQRHPPILGEVGGIAAFRNGPPERPDGEPVGSIFDAALEHRPAGGYGSTWWNAERAEVYWIPADWSTDEEEQAALAAFLAIPGVESAPPVEAESAAPTGDGWQLVWSYALRGPAPSIALPDVPGLAELRHDVCCALRAAGIEYAENHGWTPHLTLDYTDEPTPPPDWILGSPLAFDALTVAQGDVGADYPLGDTLTADLAAAMRQPIRDADAPTSRIETVLRAAGDPGWTPPPASELVDENEIVDRIRRRVEPARQKVVETMMAPALEHVGLSFDATNPVAEGLVTSQHVTNIADTTRLNVMRIVRASYASGLGVRETGEAIRHGMAEASRGRAELIAQTEIVGLTNGASVAVAKIVGKHAGVTYRKQWATAPGARWPRHETYPGLNGQEVGIDEYFSVGRAQLLYPGDPSGPVHEIARCRCTTLMVEHGQARPQQAGNAMLGADDVPADGRAGIADAAQAIGQVIRPPSKVDLAVLPDDDVATARLLRDGRIGIHPSDHARTNANAITHEYGHSIDKYLGGGEFATEQGQLDDLLAVMRDSPTMRAVRNDEVTILRGDTQTRNYMLQGREMFARAFHQYVAQRSGNPVLMAELNAIRADPLLSFQFWADEEFAPIAAELERVLDARGLLAVPPEATATVLAGQLAEIRSSVEWLTPREAALRAAENTPTGYDPYLYPLSTDPNVVSGLSREQLGAVMKAGELVEGELSVPDALIVNADFARVDVARAEEAAARQIRIARAEIDPLQKAAGAAERAANDRIALERYGRPYDQLEYVEKAQVMLAVGEDDQVIAAKRAWYAAEDRTSVERDRHADLVSAARAEHDAARSELAAASRAEALRVLGEARPMGPGDAIELQFKTITTPAKGAKKATGLLTDAQRFLPREWISKVKPIDAGTKNRGYHLGSTTSKGHIIRTSNRASGVAGDKDGLPVALHELGHAVEVTNPLVLEAERAFYEWRVRGKSFEGRREGKHHAGAGYDRDEMVRDDEFANAYMGKDYGDRAFELVSMGLEGVFMGTQQLDPEYRRFMLGLLALL